MKKPLDGITVVDLSRALAGPYCTALLADMGATIIKVESINGGDSSRQWGPFQEEHSLYFESVNRSKSSVCLNLYSPEGRNVLAKLIAKADVLVENFKVGTLDKMGLNADYLQELRPGIIVASVSGFGLTGPLRDDAGLDQVVQGMSGLMSVTGSGPNDIYRVGVSIVDITSGMVCAFGIVSALFGRNEGQPIHRISTSLLETALNLSIFQGQGALSLNQAPSPQGNNHPTITPYGTFKTATEPINVAVGNDKQWRAFCELLGLPELVDDPRFVTGAERTAHRPELVAIIETTLVTKPAAEWVSMINQTGIPCGPIYDYVQAFAAPQVQALGLVRQLQRRDGSELPLLRGPVSLDGEPSEITSPPPMLGEHTAEVLRGVGFSDTEIAQLDAGGHIKTVGEDE